MSAVTVAALNRKGGCAETSTLFHLAGALAAQGLRILLVNMDPQASLTQGVYGPEGTEAIPRERTVAALFDDRLDPDPADLVLDTPYLRVSILPGSHHLDRYNFPHPHELASDLPLALYRGLEEAGRGFDVVLLDNPPNLNLCTWASLLAADQVIVPVQPEDFGSQGILRVQRQFNLALATHNPRLFLAGYLLTLHDKRLVIHAAYQRKIRALYGPQVFRHVVPLATHFKEAVAARRPVALYRPKSAAARAIAAVAEELLERILAAQGRAPEFLYAGHRVGADSIAATAATLAAAAVEATDAAA